MLQHVSILYFFLLPNKVSLYGLTAFCLSIIGVVSTFLDIRSNAAMDICLQVFMWTYVLSSWVDT